MRNISHEEYDVIVLGAGAAGLMSAITAAKRSKRILVLEKSNKVGKKNINVRRWSLQFHQSVC